MGDAGPHIEDGGGLAAHEVCGHDLLVGPVEDALHVTCAGLLDGRHNVVVLGALLEAAGKVNDRDIWGWHAEGHAGQLAVELGKALANGFRGTSRRRNDVLGCAAATTPVLATTAWAIDGELGGSHRVHSGHEAFDDAILLVDDLGKWREAVRGAGSVGDDGVGSLVVGVIDANDVDWHGVLGRRGDDDLLAAACDVQLSLLLGREDASGLADVVNASRAPWNGGRVLRVEDLDFVTVHNEELLVAVDLHGNGPLVLLVDAVVLELVHHVIQIHERLVDCLDDAIWVRRRSTKHETSDAAEAVDAHSRHGEKDESFRTTQTQQIRGTQNATSYSRLALMLEP